MNLEYTSESSIFMNLASLSFCVNFAIFFLVLSYLSLYFVWKVAWFFMLFGDYRVCAHTLVRFCGFFELWLCTKFWVKSFKKLAEVVKTFLKIQRTRTQKCGSQFKPHSTTYQQKHNSNNNNNKFGVNIFEHPEELDICEWIHSFFYKNNFIRTSRLKIAKN